MILSALFLPIVGFQMQQQQQMTPKPPGLDTAVSAFRSNVDSPELLRAFDAASKSSNRSTKLKGLFFKGRYYQRRYEMGLFGGKYANKSDWQWAYNCQNSYTVTNGKKTSDYLADAWFYKAMLHFENGSRDDCLRNLKSLTAGEAKLDKLIYVEHLLWTASGNYAIGAAFPSSELRDAFVATLKKHDDAKITKATVEAVAADLRYWCSNRLRSSAQGGPIQSPPKGGG